MTTYLIDTNILIYYLAGALSPEKKPEIDTILRESFNISIITKIELLGWKGHTPEGLAKARRMLDCARCLSLTDAIAEKRSNYAHILPSPFRMPLSRHQRFRSMQLW